MKRTKIFCFGDSITYGEKDKEQGGWTDRLKRHYLSEHSSQLANEVIVYNLGVASETTDGLVHRFQPELGARLIKGQQSIVILAYGANDIVIRKNKNTVPESFFERNLTQAIRFAKEKSIHTMLCEILPIADSVDGLFDFNKNVRYSSDVIRYNELLKELSEKHCCQLISMKAFYKNK